jgi:hypothetical protein
MGVPERRGGGEIVDLYKKNSLLLYTSIARKH